MALRGFKLNRPGYWMARDHSGATHVKASELFSKRAADSQPGLGPASRSGPGPSEAEIDSSISIMADYPLSEPPEACPDYIEPITFTVAN